MTHSPDTPATPEGDAISRALPNAYYECAGCTQQGSESNCRPSDDIRLAPDETWLCEYCYDDAAYECGEDANWPVWADLPKLSAALRRAPVSAGKVKSIAEAAIRDCEAGAPISAANLARDILSALQPGDGWQDISSAPKDGTWFLAFIAELGLGSIRYVHFADAYDRFPINADSRCWSRAPTHWAPLPASLTGETQG